MIFVSLTDQQTRELQTFSRAEVGRVALRAHMVLLSGRRFSVPEIARIHDCGADVVRLWLSRYQELGVNGLRDDPRSGRPPKYSEAEQVIDTQASQSPSCSGHPHARWTVVLLTAFLASRFFLRLSRSTVRRFLKLAGWRWGRPRLAPASSLQERADPEHEAKMWALREAMHDAVRGLRRLVFLDESDLQLLPVIRSTWMKGPRLRIPTPGVNVRQAFFGALDAATGTWFYLTETSKLAVHLVRFLQQIVAHYPGERITLAMDNVKTHYARVVRRWLAEHPLVDVLWLPRYAAHDVNPVERIWGMMKDAVAADRLSGTILALVESAKRFFRDMPPHPVRASALVKTMPDLCTRA